jgi:hypothetical protein
MSVLAILALCIPLVFGRGLRRGHLTPLHFQVTPYEVGYGIVHVVASQVSLFSSFYLALGYVVTHPESVPCTCEEGYRPYQPLLHRPLHNSLPLPPGPVLVWRP